MLEEIDIQKELWRALRHFQQLYPENWEEIIKEVIEDFKQSLTRRKII